MCSTIVVIIDANGSSGRAHHIHFRNARHLSCHLRFFLPARRCRRPPIPFPRAAWWCGAEERRNRAGCRRRCKARFLIDRSHILRHYARTALAAFPHRRLWVRTRRDHDRVRFTRALVGRRVYAAANRLVRGELDVDTRTLLPIRRNHDLDCSLREHFGRWVRELVGRGAELIDELWWKSHADDLPRSCAFAESGAHDTKRAQVFPERTLPALDEGVHCAPQLRDAVRRGAGGEKKKKKKKSAEKANTWSEKERERE